MNQGARERIMSTPLRADTRGTAHTVRVAQGGYLVATVSKYMNDPSDYAALFADAPTMLSLLENAIGLLGGEPNDFSDPDQVAFFEQANALLKRHEAKP